MSLEEEVNVIFSEIASQREWHKGLGMTPQQAAMIKFHFSLNQLSLDAQIEILENLGYTIHIKNTMPG